MNGGASAGTGVLPSTKVGRAAALMLVAVAVVVTAVFPPVIVLSSRYAFVEALQYCAFALVAPLLIALAPLWRLGGIGGRAEKLLSARRAHPSPLWVAAVVVPALAVEVLWRMPFFVDQLARNHALLVLEAVTLLPGGVAIWLECIESPPLSPRLQAPGRIVVIAVSMWTIWVLAYAVGLSTADAYPAYAHVRGSILDTTSDQQVTAGVLWFVSACCFIPFAFRSLFGWLREAPSSSG